MFLLNLNTRARTLLFILVLGMALGGLLHEVFVPHTLDDLDHLSSLKTCAVCQVLSHDVGLAPVALAWNSVLWPESDAYVSDRIPSLSHASFPPASRAPPVHS